MSAAKDARINTALPSHPKTKKLLRALGPDGGWYLVRLFLWATENRSDGDLSGMADDDIELAIDWPGDVGAFVMQLAAVGFIDGDAGGRRIHDWSEHNPWAAGAKQRSIKAQWNAAKRHHGEAAADRLVPDHRASSIASSTTPALQLVPTSTAPLPSPSPYPRAERPIARQAARFEEFWAAYPNKKGRAPAHKAWKSRGLDAQADQIIADVRARIVGDGDWLRGYIPHGSTYVSKSGWLDAITQATSGPAAANDVFAGAQ